MFRTKKSLIIHIIIIFLSASAGYSEMITEENRLALVIGNADYNNLPLKNPINDATDMANLLITYDFKVIVQTDADLRNMTDAIQEFGSLLTNKDVGLFFFAGHGLQVGGHNYLVPVDAAINSESDIKNKTLNANLIYEQMNKAGNKINIVILDACRNNPFAKTLSSVSQGLAEVDAPTGSIISYATAPGATSYDGYGRNGIFTKNLLTHMNKKGLTINEILILTRKSVIKETNSRQVPWESSSLTDNFYFWKPDSNAEKKSLSLNINSYQDPAEMEFWHTVKSDGTIEAYRTYLNTYPHGKFAPLAKLRLTPQKSLPYRENIKTESNLNPTPGKGVTVRPARATWYSGYFQDALYSRGLKELGYDVKKTKELKNHDFYRKVAQGEVDYWANGWFPMHRSYGYDPKAIIAGTVSRLGAISGYVASKNAVEKYQIKSLSDFKRVDVRKAFDSNGDGKADLIGCPSGWSCKKLIENHIKNANLEKYINIVSGSYKNNVEKAILRHKKGQPILFYTWAPNWTIGNLMPGKDLLWLNVATESTDQNNFVYGLEGAVTNPVNLGFKANDIKIVANKKFLDQNPCAKKFFEVVTLSLNDISEQVLKMHNGKTSYSEVQSNLDEWINDNRDIWNTWLDLARLAKEKKSKI